MHVLKNIVQGSHQWLAIRANYFTASECPAALGLSKFMTRTELLAQKSTGYTPEVDAATQSRFDAGHQAEALARPIVEELIETDLYPVVAALDVDGLPLLASFDGISMDESVIWESKLWNERLASAIEGGELPDSYWPQVEHQLLVSSAEKCYFTVSDGTPERTRGFWYFSDPERKAKIIAGWKQFAIDLAAYAPTEATAPTPTGKAPETLPALHIEVTGMVTASNLAAFKETALSAIRGVNRELSTDADFADAEKAVKWCADVEDRLKAAKEHALSQTQSIDQLFKAIDDIAAEARSTRIELDKLVKARKEAIKGDIVTDGTMAFKAHIDGLNKRIGRQYMPHQAMDFAGAIKGKRSIDSIRDAVDTELSRAKIAANAIADKIQVNLQVLTEICIEHADLFPDVGQLVHKDGGDLAELINGRMAAHKLREAQRIEAERARIRQEEESRAKMEIDRANREAMAKLEAFQSGAAPAMASPGPDMVSAQTVAVPNVVPLPMRAVTDTGSMMKLGELNARLAPIAITTEGLLSLGFSHAATDKAAKLYHSRDFGNICAALVRHIERVQESVAA